MLPTSVSASMTTIPGPMTARKVFHPEPEIRESLRTFVACWSNMALCAPALRLRRRRYD
jgi:hypothetical protein